MCFSLPCWALFQAKVCDPLTLHPLGCAAPPSLFIQLWTHTGPDFLYPLDSRTSCTSPSCALPLVQGLTKMSQRADSLACYRWWLPPLAPESKGEACSADIGMHGSDMEWPMVLTHRHCAPHFPRQASLSGVWSGGAPRNLKFSLESAASWKFL